MSGETNQRAETKSVSGTSLHYTRSGFGPSLVFLHNSIGSYPVPPLVELLAKEYSVFQVDLPGFGQSGRPTWASDVRDLAIQMNLLLDELGLTDVTLVGSGFGGWVAAEMATMNQLRLRQLVLIGAAGIQPRQGEIVDQLTIDYVDYIRLGFADEAPFQTFFGQDPPVPVRLQVWQGREMAMRVTWKPWMFRHSLPYLLTSVKVPTLILWGADDRIIPVDCGRQFAESLPNSRLMVIPNAGHFVVFEQPDAVAEAIANSVAAKAR